MDNIPYRDMQFLFTGELPTSVLDRLNAAMETNIQVQQHLAATLAQNNAVLVEAMQQLANALSSPRKLILDNTGKPIGSELVNKL
mgnify:CR=1 FL=1